MQQLQFEGVREWKDEFLSLFPHRFDYIFAAYPKPNESPLWQTESRHPLSDRLIQQGSCLYGVRFGRETRYCMVDIDADSPYHPSRDCFAVSRLIAALEPLGLVHCVVCTSSDSGGIHLYFPFETAVKTYQLAIALQTLLENAGFYLVLGQLEIFPNPKPYNADGQPSLYSAHRLPLQVGSYLLNQDWQRIHTTPVSFVNGWRFAARQNLLDPATVESVVKTAWRKRYGFSGKVDKFLNDLNTEIEVGWTDHGQTNFLLGRIALRSYVFGHILYAAHPLEGKPLVEDIVRVARSLPGYTQWCRHQHEIEKRAEEWARCVESSRYFHFQRRRQLSTSETAAAAVSDSPSWNQRQREEARERIRGAIADLLNKGTLPSTATLRFQSLLQYGIGGGSLYRHRDLWHPANLQQPVEIPPDPPASLTVCGWESVGTASHPQDSPSLLEEIGGDTSLDKGFDNSKQVYSYGSGNNSLNDLENHTTQLIAEHGSPAETNSSADKAIKDKAIKDKAINLEAQHPLPLGTLLPTKIPQPNLAMAYRLSQQDQQALQQARHTARLQQYLVSGDPILIAEALACGRG